MAAPVKVHGPPLSTAVSRVLVCLIEKDVPFQLLPVNMAKGEHKMPEYLKIQPFGQVPAFEDESITLFESELVLTDFKGFSSEIVKENKMDATTEGKKEEEASGMANAPEYNSSTMKKARLQSTLAALLSDPVLADVPKKPSLSDVDTLINLELGSAMRITVLKLDGTSFEVALMNSATVKDLKLAIKKKVNDAEESRMGHRHISWKHVWGNFCLLHSNEKLLDDSSSLQNYGVRNNSQVQFIPYVASRASRRHSRRRKHRFFHGLNRKS